MSVDARVALIGFGEVGQILAADLSAGGARDLAAWDIRFADAASPPSRAVGRMRVRAGASGPDAVRDAQVVLCAVTAARDVEAARATAAGLAQGAWFIDLNSASPEMKKEAARIVEARGARYVEAAVMAAVPPRRLATPMLLGGPHAEAFMSVAHALGLSGARFFSRELGRASAAKMCRSVIVKGLEALLAECMITARHYGVEESVLESLHDLFADGDWRKRSRYMISRSLMHGSRRAEEMREVARTVADAGVQPLMSDACAQRQQWAAQHAPAAAGEDLAQMLDAILAARQRPDSR